MRPYPVVGSPEPLRRGLIFALTYERKVLIEFS